VTEVIEVIEDESFVRDDWYAEEWSGRGYQRCTFSEVDFTEAVTRGVVFNGFPPKVSSGRKGDHPVLRLPGGAVRGYSV
jgi:hypothetical protein